MPYIITNTSKGLNPKSKSYNKSLTISLKDGNGAIVDYIIDANKPLILNGNYLPKQLHFLQIKGLVTITNISGEQFNFIKNEEEIKEEKKVIEKQRIIEIEKEELKKAESNKEELKKAESNKEELKKAESNKESEEDVKESEEDIKKNEEDVKESEEDIKKNEEDVKKSEENIKKNKKSVDEVIIENKKSKK